MTTSASSTIDPALAQGAQIPLQTFEIPSFPPEAQGLRALTLTCDIKTDEYTDHLQLPVPPVPSLPRSITSLTLEIFSLGYPAGFLTALAKELPNVKELVVYSQLMGGITTESQEDAIQAFREWKELRSLHLLDVFGRPDFFEHVANELRERKKGLMFLEISYTFRHEDGDFLARIPKAELPLFVSAGLKTCAFNMGAPEKIDDEQDPVNLAAEDNEELSEKTGIQACNQTLTPELVKMFTGEKRPTDLRMLNLTIYTVDVSQLRDLLEAHKSLAVINVTVSCEPSEKWKEALLDALTLCPDLEQAEIVANPSLEFTILMSNSRRRAETIPSVTPTQADMERLAKSCPKLASLAANILRSSDLRNISWKKAGDSWHEEIAGTETQGESSAPEPTSSVRVVPAA